MSVLKTEYGYNENDFVEKDGVLQELTVTITLGEYRDLITTNEVLSADIETYRKEVNKLTEQNKSLAQTILALNGGKMIRDIGKAIGNAFAPNEKETEENDNETDT